MTAPENKIHVSKNLGRYNWAGTEKEWCVNLTVSGPLFQPVFEQGRDFRNISVMFDEDQEPDVEGVPTSELVSVLRERLARRWYTKRDYDMACLNWLSTHAEAVDAVWASAEVKRLEAEQARTADRIAYLQSTYLEEPPA